GQLHPFAEQFLHVVKSECADTLARSPGRLAWADIEQIFKRITLRIMFGSQAGDDTALIESLDRLMFQANRLFLLTRNASFETLNRRIDKYLSAPEPYTLAALCWEFVQTLTDPRKPTAQQIDVASQVPHWLFAMKDTLAINTAYCLVLLADHP